MSSACSGTTPTGYLRPVWPDSAYYAHNVLAAIGRAGARFSVTARNNPAVRTAIGSIAENAWTAIRYPNAIWEQEEGRWISDAEVAEIPFTAFTSRRAGQQIHARLIVRRVKRLNPAHSADQGELFAAYRYHSVLTDSPQPMLEAEAAHRAHAIIEQVHADLKNGPLAHLPSGSFTANAAWLALAVIAFNLTRAAGCLASAFHAKATTGTIRAQLITVPARLARSARRLRLHLPSTGRGNSNGPSCSTPLSGRQQSPDRRPPRRKARPEPNNGRAGQTGRPHMPTPRSPVSARNRKRPRTGSVDPGSAERRAQCG